MTLITADIIFDGAVFLPDHTVLQIADDGRIEAILQTNDLTGITKYEGLLMPGMINAHCHLELSHMKGLVAEKTGLVPFLLSILSTRNVVNPEAKQAAIEAAEREMLQNGIVAVGDISNTTDTLVQKAKQNLHYHTFVECLGLREEKAREIYLHAKEIQQQFESHGQSSLVLHAPYTLSQQLISLVDEDSEGKITSIHNQECEAENELLLHRSGAFLQLFEAVHFDKNNFKSEGKNSIQTYLPQFAHQQKLILVHNTVTSAEDIAFAKASGKQLYWCLCPNANLYIENRLPTIEMMIAEGCNIVLGTDSLASNHSLSIWDEIKTIRKYKPGIPLETMLKWACSNGAAALGMSDDLGSITVDKKPGLVHIAHYESEESIPVKIW